MMGVASKFLKLLTTPFPLLYTRTSALRLTRFSRVSLASLSSVQKHIFFTNYRSFPGFSIKPFESIHTQTSSVTREDFHGDPPGFSSNSRVFHSWPEWSKLVENLRDGGYFDRQTYSVHGDDAFSELDNLPEEFVRAANACLLFARDRPDLLGLLSRRDIEVVVANGSPFLFKSAVDSMNRMNSFLGRDGYSELEMERAYTVNLVHFLLSYACNPVAASGGNKFNNRELVESSVCKLLNELANASRNVRGLELSGSVPRQFSNSYGQTLRPLGQNTEMKRGDWICPKCNFMNFARNMKCLECDEARPKRHPTGGEWECPLCDFYNYGRNAVCLRCDCKRPGEASIGNSVPRPSMGYVGNNQNKVEIESKLSANEEKAERWFSKISQLDNASDLSSAIADEDFPEIMPLRKGESRFIVSTRKTPLERRLANAQYRRNLGNDGVTEENGFQSAENGMGPSKTRDMSTSKTLGRTLGRSSAVPEMSNDANAAKENSGAERIPLSSSAYPQHRQTEKLPEIETSAESSKYRISAAPATPEIQGGLVKSECKTRVLDCENVSNTMEWKENSQPSRDSWHTGFSGRGVNGSKVDSVYGGSPGTSTQRPGDLQVSNSESWNSGSLHESSSYAVSSENNNRDSWKSLEGSAVKELDPLDMSEEAKAERWFRRVAQIKDISELSKIPDEDFPQIMPMRKGVNRFVVSKRKTPMERRLTSPQYRRNLPIVNSDPVKKENDSS